MRLKIFGFVAVVCALVVALLVSSCSSVAPKENKPIRALLVIGGCCHDYRHQRKVLTEGISARANVEWTIVHEGDGSTTHKMSIYDDPDWAKNYDVVVHDECCADVKDKDFVEGILKPHRAGLPAVNLHCAMHCYRVDFDKFKDWFEFTGIDSRSHGALLPIGINFLDANHPITKGMTNWTTIPEELYNNVQIWTNVTPLVTGRQGGESNVVAWVNNYRGTRVFSTTLGHTTETVSDARYLDLITRGLLWSVNKLNADYLKPAKQVLMADKNRKKVLVPVNVALNKPATASASQDGHEPGHAVDDNSDTRWCASDNANGYWWQVDLQKPEAITGCRIIWEKGDQPYQYRIEGSADGKSWKMLVEEKGVQGRPENDQQKFTASDVRYVRITITKAPEGAWASFWEFEVFGKQMVETSVDQVPDVRLTGVKVPPRFDKTIFAGPPDVSYPTCIAAVPTGEVFVGMDQNGSLDTQPNRGWVVRCVDTDGDGVADKFNTFAKMDSPRGIVFDHNTLYVMHPPVLEAFYDDNGDGVSDRSEVLVRGLARDLSFRGADHTCNGVRMGIDGWLYIALGDYGATKAVGKDGSELQVHGGGIVRVRPDGSNLELVVQGTRNIYDVAIDPLMNIFTCDNTNDGDDWNVRLSHMIPTASYGYPSLFKHFPDEIMNPLADYGGGSPTGAIFLDEPGFPDGFGYGLYTCQWGWNNVTRHPLESNGASFAAKKESFVNIPRPTGIDADGEGNLYVASLKGATFNYAGPEVGYVLRVAPSGSKPTPFPDLKKTSDGQLLKYLASPSAVWRFHMQREILRRGRNATFTRGLEKLALSKENLPVRVAAIFTLKQLLGTDAQKPLLLIAKNEQVRAYALQALADGKKETAKVPTKVFADALNDKNPAVRLQAVIALNRLGRTESAEAILPLTADSDPAIAHVAFRALVSLHAVDACFKALDQSNSTLIPGAMRVLRNLHDPRVVDGLTERLNRTQSASTHQLILEALCRLYYCEADWDGSWWGTRPDTSGPYFQPVTWKQSDQIAQALRNQMTNADDATLSFLLGEFQRHKLDLPDLASSLIKIAAKKPSLQSPIAKFIVQRSTVPKDAIPLLERVTLDGKEDLTLRVRAFEGIQRTSDEPDAPVRVLMLLDRAGETELVKLLRDNFIRDAKHAKNIASFEKLIVTGDSTQRELAFGVLLQIVTNTNMSATAKSSAQQAIEAAWKSDAIVSLLRAIGDARVVAYTNQVRSHLNDTAPYVVSAATYALEKLGQSTQVAIPSDRKGIIGKMSFEDVMKVASAAPGDAKAGAQLFEKVGCNKCHTTSKNEPLKGPFLGDIAARYNRSEIVTSIVRPNAQIAQGFVTTTVELKDGTEYEGFIVRESGDEVEIRNILGTTVLPKKEIAKRGTRTTSIMPEGLVDQLTPEELSSLLAYLQSLKA
ncbi:MAG: heme-binding protein [Pedosphaera sp.]|nr:heme-binding protein [Pedosphaera sp.]